MSEREPRPARFVLLRHDWPEPHRDLILEWPGEAGRDRLSTWALYPEDPAHAVFPADRPTAGRAVPLEPHRAAYLDYEGPVSGDRGHVVRECAGLVLQADRGTSQRFVLRIENPAGKPVQGELTIGPAAAGSRALAIRVSDRHEALAATGFGFTWKPADPETA